MLLGLKMSNAGAVTTEGVYWCRYSVLSSDGRSFLLRLVLLNLSLTFYNVWPTLRIRWQGHLSAELAAVIVGLAVWLAARGATTPQERAQPGGASSTCWPRRGWRW